MKFSDQFIQDNRTVIDAAVDMAVAGNAPLCEDATQEALEYRLLGMGALPSSEHPDCWQRPEDDRLFVVRGERAFYVSGKRILEMQKSKRAK